MDARDILLNRKFCPMPWTGLMYNFDGKVKNCIRSAGSIGNIKDQPIEQILSGSRNQLTQQQITAGVGGDHCYTCYDLERDKKDFNIISDRIFYIRELKHTDRTIYDNPGAHDLRTVDVRWTNLCNFGCVYCGPEFSSRWASELDIVQQYPTDQQKAEFKQYIFDHADQLQHVYMAGGEPLLMKENLELLELLKHKNPKVNLRINTNLSKVDTRVFERICEFANVHWTVSVESQAEEFEYIRYGGSWRDFLENLNQIRQLGHKISFNMLHFLLNYRTVFDCVDFLQGLGFHNNSFIIGALLNPRYLNIRHLPDSVLQSVKEILIHRISQQPGYLLEDSYQNLLAYIQQPFEKDLAGSIDSLTKLDQRRNLNSKEVFAELYKLI